MLSSWGVGGAAAAVVLGCIALAGCGDGGGATTSPGPTGSGPAATGPVSSGPAASDPPATRPTTSGPAPTATSRPPDGPKLPPPGATGFFVEYPPGWRPSGQVQATAFAAGATCGSALIVDRAPPAGSGPGSGPGASVEQSYVQVCWASRNGRTLAEFMAATYGGGGGFQPATLAGRPAFVSRSGTSSTWFVDTASHRWQVVTAVAATPELTPTRLAEVDRVLASLSLPD